MYVQQPVLSNSDTIT